MKKAGILTFHRAFNYGAVLQAFALRKTFEKLGHAAEIIDYGKIGQTPRFPMDLSGFKPFLSVMVLNFLSLGNADIRRRRFRTFQKEQMKLSTARYKSTFEIKKAGMLYDSIIIGSDQVWNPNLTIGDTTFLLDFARKSTQKISYAASFGLKNLPEKYINTYKNLISEFDHISVREKDGKKLVFELTGREPEVTLDPTLLLTANEWIAVAKPNKIKKPYIICYNIMGDPPGIIEFCKKLQIKTGFQIIRIANPVYKFERGIKIHSTAGPKEFLGLFENASIVVTNSFHGTAFSIIFKKPFFTFLYNNDRDIRLKEITGKLGLENRLINPDVSYKIEDFKEIDFDEVYEKLDKEKELSIRFLQDALGK